MNAALSSITRTHGFGIDAQRDVLKPKGQEGHEVSRRSTLGFSFCSFVLLVVKKDITGAPRPVENQKLNITCRSRRRFADELGANGPPCRALETPKYCELRTPPGFAKFTLLKTLRTPSPSVRL